MKKNETIEQVRKAALKKLRTKLYKIFGCRSISVIEHFSGIIDPRSDQGKRHPLLSIIVIALCGVICRADGWAQIEEIDFHFQFHNRPSYKRKCMPLTLA